MICITVNRWTSFIYAGSSGEEETEADEEDADAGSSDEEDEAAGGGIIFPGEYASILAQILRSTRGKPVLVRDFGLGTEMERVGLAYALWSEGVISTVGKRTSKPAA